jgi:TonB family protein
MATIYLGDRDEAYRRSLAHALRRRGDEVLEFSSGAELYARAVASPPDLVVLETELDELDGFQVFSKLHRERPNNPLSVVFVAEFEHPRVARVVKQRGALGYIGKGRDLDRVVDDVRGFARGEGRDPLDGRTLSAAVAWLQSRGKSGRLEVEANGTSGYVLLHHGRILEARWGDLSGEPAVSTIAENLDRATFRFAEGVDELEAPRVRIVGAGPGKTAPDGERAATPESEGAPGQPAAPEDLRRALAEGLDDEGPDAFPRIDEGPSPAGTAAAEPAARGEVVIPPALPAPPAPAAPVGVPGTAAGSVAEMVRRALEEPPRPESEAATPSGLEPAGASPAAPPVPGRDDAPAASHKPRRPDRGREQRRRRGGRSEPAAVETEAPTDTGGDVPARPELETADVGEVTVVESTAEHRSAAEPEPGRADVPAAETGQPAAEGKLAAASAAVPAADASAPAPPDASGTPSGGPRSKAPGERPPVLPGADLRRLTAPRDLRVPVPGERPEAIEVPGADKRIEAPAPSGSRRVPSRRPPPMNPAVGGAVAAALELRLAWEQEAEEVRRHRANRRRSVAVAAMIALLLGLGVAFAAIFPGSVPQALAGILGTLGIADERDADPITQMARAGDDELGAALDVEGLADGGAAGAGGGDPDREGDAAAAGEGGFDRVSSGSADGPPRLPADGTVVPAPSDAAAGERIQTQAEEPAAAAPETVEPDPAAERARELAEQRRREELAERRARQRALEQQRALERQRAAAAAAEAEAADETPAAETVAEAPAPRRETAPPVDVAAADPEPRRQPAEEAPAPSREPAPAPPRAGAPAVNEDAGENPPIVKPVLLSRGRDPYYPPELEAQDIGGSVLLNIRVGSNGRAQRVEIRRSSGYEALDQAAVAAVGTFLWDPARGAAGPTEAWVTQAVTFRP